MARTCTEESEEEETLLISHHNQHQEDDDDDKEEEALSLCDFPVNLSNEKVQFQKQPKEEEEEEEVFGPGFEFETGTSFRAGSDSCDPAPADELFFKGRILPLCHSVSLDAGLPGSNRLITRSESVDFRRIRTGPDRKIRNNFIDYSQPSPTPQIRRSSSMTARVNTIKNPSIWEYLRLGLVRTPEIDLRNATAGNAKLSVSRNSSCSSTSTSSNSKKSKSGNRRRKSLFFGDCKCSIATETIVLPVKMNETEEKQRRKTAKKEEKTAMARKRTFEWLKELSQVGFVVDHGRRRSLV